MEYSIFGMFVTVAVAHFLALISPGPDFILVVKSAVKNGNKKSIGVAAGIASANAVYISLCLIGVGSILASSLILLVALKVAGGLFLIYLAIIALLAKKSSYKDMSVIKQNTCNVETNFAREYVTGFMSGILNPKNLLFYMSLFTVVLTQDVNMSFKVTLGIWMTSVVFLWDLFIIYLLSTSKVQNKFSKISYYLDKVTGAVLGLIGLKILKSALTK